MRTKLTTSMLALVLALALVPAVARADDDLVVTEEVQTPVVEVVTEEDTDQDLDVVVEETSDDDAIVDASTVDETDAPDETEAVEGTTSDDTEVDPATTAETGAAETDADDIVTDDPAAPADETDPAPLDDAEEIEVDVPGVALEGGDGNDGNPDDDDDYEDEPWRWYNPADDFGNNVYRLYNRWTGEHFYTESFDEAMNLVQVGWNWEGTGWVAPSVGEEVYRLYNPYAGDHHYTTDATERDNLVSVGWVYENVAFYSYYSQLTGGKQVLRQYNPYAQAGSHNFTTSESENNDLIAAGWLAEGLAWNCMDRDPIPFDEPFWAIQENGDRFWVQTDTSYAKDRLITPSEGAGYYAYARSNGAVIRGTYDTGSWIYFADKTTGELPSGSGWTTTSDFGQGSQLYYLENGPLGILGAKEGYATTGGYAHYVIPNKGYVLRGKLTSGNYVYLADSTGHLPTTAGWLTTGTYDNGTSQRYYLETCPTGGLAARTGHFTVSGSHYYGRPKVGYVLRGWLKSGNGYLMADLTTGALAWGTGVITTSAYEGSTHIYFIDQVCADGMYGAVISRFSTYNGNKYYSDASGYVRTGQFKVDGLYYYADSTGKITLPPCLYPDMLQKAQGYSSSTGWLILVDCTNNHCCIYQGSYGHWVPVKEWICTTGAAGTPTKKGVFTVGSKGYSFGNGYTCYYYTQFSGDFLFHSVLYYPGTFNVMDGRLGIDASHGCVRLALENAKYIYDNVPYGSTVVTYSAA